MKGRITAAALCFLAANPITASPAIAAWSPEAQACSDRKGELEVVLDACTKAILSGILNQDQLPKTFNNRGLIFYRKGDIDQAIKSFDQAVRLKPDLAEEFIDRGLANAAKGQHGSALRDYDQVLPLEPHKAAALFNRGTQYLNSGEPALAKKDFRRLLELEPTNSDAEKRLAAAIERQRLAGGDQRPILAAEGGKLLAKIGAPPAQSPARVMTAPTAPAVDNVEIAARIKRAQSLLGQLAKLAGEPALSAGAVDGMASRKTRTAVEQFQRQTGATVTGEIDEALLGVLEGAVVTAKAENDRLQEERRIKLAAEQERKAEAARQQQIEQQAAEAERRRLEEQAQIAAAAERKRQDELTRVEAQGAALAEQRRKDEAARLAELERKRQEELAKAETERRRAEAARAEAERLQVAQTEQAAKARAQAQPRAQAESPSPAPARPKPPDEINPPAGLVQAAIATFQRYQGYEANNGRLTGAQLAELHTRARYNRSVTRQPLPPVSFNDLQRRHRRGEVEAKLLLGQMFDPSFIDAGQRKDALDATYYYEEAASKGSLAAAFQLGLIYKDGMVGVEADAKKALDWLKKAAEKGNGAAQYALVELYREAKDEVSSRHWFEKAVAQADGGAASAQVRVLGGRLIHAAIPDEHREYSS